MTAAENVAFGLRMRKVARGGDREARRRTRSTSCKLGGLGDRRPLQMSGGQRQRVALARALVINPAVLLLDEPLSNLDLKLREEMRVEIAAIQRRLGITTVFVTHDQGEALVMSDRIAVMNAGRIEQIGDPAAIYETPGDALRRRVHRPHEPVRRAWSRPRAACARRAGLDIAVPVPATSRPARRCTSRSGPSARGSRATRRRDGLALRGPCARCSTSARRASSMSSSPAASAASWSCTTTAATRRFEPGQRGVAVGAGRELPRAAGLRRAQSSPKLGRGTARSAMIGTSPSSVVRCMRRGTSRRPTASRNAARSGCPTAARRRRATGGDRRTRAASRSP